MSASDFGGASPLKFWGRKKHSFNYAILRLYCKYLHIGTRYRRLENGLQTAILPVHAYQIWWTLVHKRRKWDRSTHSKSTFSDAHMSEGKGRWSVKISQLLNDDQRWVCPQHFLTPKIRKLAKNLVYYNYIIGVCCGNCGKRFYLVGE